MKLLIMMFVLIKSLLFRAEEKPLEKPNLFLPLNIQFFAEGDGEGGEGGSGEGDGEGGAGNDDPKPYATFKNKDDLNKRLSRAKNEGQKALAKELGFETIEAMQTALKKPDVKDKESDVKDVDIDKVVEEKLKDERAKGFKRLLNAEVKLVAKELDFADYEDALALADLSEVKENEKGDLEGVEEALKALAEKKPHLLKSKGNGGFGSDISTKRKNEKENLEQIKKLAQSRGSQATAAHDPWKR